MVWRRQLFYVYAFHLYENKVHTGGIMYKKTVLKNGLRVVSEKIPYVRSVSLGVWVNTGSRNEDVSNNGISHFIEHMLFKGTNTRTAKEIAESIDAIGGQLNAFTGKECTCYYTKTLDTHLNISVELLADMLFNSILEPKDIDLERKVILEEIGMYEDSPEELVHDILSEAAWKGNAIGYPILGTKECLEKINRDAILKHMKKRYTPGNTVIAVAGNFDEQQLMDLINRYFGHWSSDQEELDAYTAVKFNPDQISRIKDIEQVHVCMGFEGIENGNDQLYALLALNNVLGGGMSSRLFQKIREERGLVYSIYSYPVSYKKAGMFTICAGMKPEQLDEVVSLVFQEIGLLTDKGLLDDELIKSKEQLKGSYILGLESTSSRMNSIGKSELMLRKTNTPEEILQKIDNIQMGSVREVIDRVLKIDKISFSMVGKKCPKIKLD